MLYSTNNSYSSIQIVSPLYQNIFLQSKKLSSLFLLAYIPLMSSCISPHRYSHLHPDIGHRIPLTKTSHRRTIMHKNDGDRSIHKSIIRAQTDTHIYINEPTTATTTAANNHSSTAHTQTDTDTHTHTHTGTDTHTIDSLMPKQIDRMKRTRRDRKLNAHISGKRPTDRPTQRITEQRQRIHGQSISSMLLSETSCPDWIWYSRTISLIAVALEARRMPEMNPVCWASCMFG